MSDPRSSSPSPEPRASIPREPDQRRPRWGCLTWGLLGSLAILGSLLRWIWGDETPAQPAFITEPTPGGPPRAGQESLPPEEIRHPDGRIEHPRVRYERRDVRVRWIIGVLILFGCLGVAHLFLLWWMLQWQMEAADRAKRSPYPLAPQPSARLPLPPRLEQIDRMEGLGASDVFKREAARLRLLESYGPTEDAGYLHIPIEQAIDRLADRLPVRKQPPPSGKDHGLMDSGESNSGRMARGVSP